MVTGRPLGVTLWNVRYRRWLPAMVVAAIAAGTSATLGWRLLVWYRSSRIMQLLQAGSPDSRKAGAWEAADRKTPRAIGFIADQLAASAEPDPQVRESYVYALGRAGGPQHFDLVAALIEREPAGWVRQAAWLAAARLAPERFAELAARHGDSEQPWDQIGVAAAWLELGDVRGVEVLLHWAVRGDAGQRQASSAAMYRRLAPLLEALGRWPLRAQPAEGQTWSPELVAAIADRCRQLDLPAIAADLRRALERSAGLRRDLGRLNGARRRLARLLLDQE